MSQSKPRSARRPPGPDPFDEGARETLIEEQEFLELLRDPLNEFFSHGLLNLPLDTSRWPKRCFSLLAEKSSALESFLDDFDARNNRRFSVLVELVASLRGFATIAQILHHIRIRFPKYKVRLRVDDMESFHRSLREAGRFAHQSLSRLFVAVRDEFTALGGLTPEFGEEESTLGEEPVRRHLPHDIDAEEGSSDEAKLAAVLTGFLEVADFLRRSEGIRPADNQAALQRFLEEHYDETKARAIEAKVHNIQSAYDTHVKFTAMEARHPQLRHIRGHISLALHLLELGTFLVHFVERHESAVQYPATTDRIGRLVKREEALRFAIQFALYHACNVVISARPMVTELLPHFVQHEEIELELPKSGVLHARPLSLIVSIVRRHGTAVDLVIDGESCVASSIMGLILFAGRHPDARKISFRGDRRPLEHLRLLFENGLGEHGLDKLPEELGYLRL